MYIKLIVKLLSLFDYFHKKKIINFLKREKLVNIEIFFDVGGHYGETINLFNKNFKIQNFFTFEASPINFKILKKKIEKFGNDKIRLFNIALGDENKEVEFNQAFETQSSTLLQINKNSKYFIRKRNILSLKNSNYFEQTIKINSMTLQKFNQKNLIKKIDFLKIDTEGYDFNVIKGLGADISKVRYIYFEHHFHDMFKKEHKFSEINSYLVRNNFVKVFKIKMMFRKTFEYIYYNKKFK